MIPKLQRGTPSTKNWSTINALIDETQRQSALITKLTSDLAAIRASSYRRTIIHPFKIYHQPRYLRPAPVAPDTGADDWRKIRVRAGMVNTYPVTGTDGYNENPDEPYFPIALTDEITVPADTETYYIWIDVSDPENPAIGHGATDPTDNTTLVLIATVDTSTYADDAAMQIRQIVRADIIAPPNECTY